MSSKSSLHQPGVQKKYVYLSFFVLLCCAIGATLFVCTQMYDSTRREYLAEEGVALTKDVRDTVAAVTVWRESLKSQASRISSSELYRLFAKEANDLGGKAGMLNESENVPQDGGDLAMLAEQVPLMRNVLLDFMNYSGFTDARIINNVGQSLLSVLARPTAVTPYQMEAVRQAIKTDKLALAPVRSTDSALMLDFADPLQAVLSGEGRDKPVAALLLTTGISGQVGRFLSSDSRMRPGASLHIVQRSGGAWQNVRVQGVEDLSPGMQQLFTGEKGDVLPFVERAALSGKGDVYSLGQRVPGMDWWVVVELPQGVVKDALKDRAFSIAIMGALTCLGFMLLLPLLWWLAVGRGQHAMALRFRELYYTIQQQKQLLDSVNVSLEVGLFMADANGDIQLCNRAFSHIVDERDEEQVNGKTLFMLFPGDGGERLLSGVNTVLREGRSTTFEVERGQDEALSLYRTTLFPFHDPDSEKVAGVVGTMQDITEFRRRAMQHQRQQVQTMSAFMRAIESIDPYLSGHSQMMKALGLLVGRQMHLDDRDVRTIAAAAELSQVGKLSLPQELLRKDGKLSEAELAEFRRVPLYANNILRDIEFELPIAEAVYAMSEGMDGKGYPRGLRAEEISIHARVLAVLNAFCAMTSPRSYRESMSADKALEILGRNAGLDQGVVQALRDVLETGEGAEVFRQRRKNAHADEA